jgi:hypothetical protein
MCGSDADCIRQVQRTTLSEFQRRGAPSEVLDAAPAPAVPTVKSIYTVDGLALGGQIIPDSASYREYRCGPSEQFPDFTWCQKKRAESSPRGSYTSSNSILHSADGTAWYVNRFLEPAFFSGTEANDDINRLSIKFGAPRTIPTPSRADAPSGFIAYWGNVVLQPLEPYLVAELASGRDVRAGLIIDHIGNFQRSARLGLPIYRLAGGAGYVWAASWDVNGRGTLRFLAVDTSKISPTPAVVAAVTPRQNPAIPTAIPPVQPLTCLRPFQTELGRRRLRPMPRR